MKQPIYFIITIIIYTSICLGQSPAVETIGIPRELTSSNYFFIAPKWSPDNTTIAVSTHKYTGIYLLSFPEGDIFILTDDPSAGFGIQWSHSGDKIASRIARFENNRRYNAIAVFDVSTESQSVITDFNTILPGTPKWLKDDDFIYLDGTDKFKLFSVAGSNSEDEQISPPDQRIVFIKNDKIKIRDVSSETEYPVTAPMGRILNLTVSPDGKKMAYEVMGGHLWVSDINGENLIDLGLGYTPAWGANSDKITYMITTDDGHRYISSDIFVINIDGTGKVNITNSSDIIEMHPSWSSDGNWIAYDTTDGKIYVQEVR